MCQSQAPPPKIRPKALDETLLLYTVLVRSRRLGWHLAAAGGDYDTYAGIGRQRQLFQEALCLLLGLELGALTAVSLGHP